MLVRIARWLPPDPSFWITDLTIGVRVRVFASNSSVVGIYNAYNNSMVHGIDANNTMRFRYTHNIIIYYVLCIISYQVYCRVPRIIILLQLRYRYDKSWRPICGDRAGGIRRFIVPVADLTHRDLGTVS